MQEGGGRWGERKEGWESSDLTDFRKMEEEERQAGIWKKSLPPSFFTLHLLILSLPFTHPPNSFSLFYLSCFNPALTLHHTASPSPVTHPDLIHTDTHMHK